MVVYRIACARKRGWSYSAGGGVSAASQEGDNLGSISIRAIAAPENLAKVKTGIFEELQRVLNDGFTAKELEDVVDGTISADVSSWSSEAVLMGMLRSAGQYGINASWFDAMHKRYEDSLWRKSMRPFASITSRTISSP